LLPAPWLAFGNIRFALGFFERPIKEFSVVSDFLSPPWASLNFREQLRLPLASG